MGSDEGQHSDVSDGSADEEPFDPWPDDVDIHVEWGQPGAVLAATRGDLVVVVDVLSFSTAVVEVAARGGVPLCFAPDDIEAAGGREALATSLDAAVLTKKRRVEPGQYSLSPASLQSMPVGQRLVMTSLNGGRCVGAAADAPWIGIGTLTNRSAVAKRIATLLEEGRARRCTVVPCAEVWGGPFMATQVGDLNLAGGLQLRPSYEDLLGAGAIVSALGDTYRRSAEAQMAEAIFAADADQLAQRLRQSVSGRELIARGFEDDVTIASQVDAHSVVPEWTPTDPPGQFASVVPPAS